MSESFDQKVEKKLTALAKYEGKHKGVEFSVDKSAGWFTYRIKGKDVGNKYKYEFENEAVQGAKKYIEANF